MSEKTYEIITDFEMKEVAPNEWCLTKYIGFDFDSGYIEIPSEIEGKKIVELGDNLFSSSKGVQRVKIGEGIKKIGNYAFAHTSIQRIYFPQSLIEIGDSAFSESSLEKLILPHSVTTIGKHVCSNAYCLEKAIVSDRISEIPEEAFLNCGRLKEFTFSDNITTICANAFANSGICSLKFPEHLTLIGDSAFYKTKLTSVIIPPSVKTIEKNAFKETPIISLEIFEGVETIGKEAFSETAIKSIVIPSSVKTIEKGAFKFCQELKEIIFKDNCQATIGNKVFNKKTIWDPEPEQIEDEDLSNYLERRARAREYYRKDISKIGRVKCFIPASISKIGSCFSIEMGFLKTKVVETFCKNTIIYCEIGSYAMDWARNHGLKCLDYHSNLSEHLKSSSVSEDSQETAIISETDNGEPIIKTEPIISDARGIETSTVTESSVLNSEPTEIKDAATDINTGVTDIVKEAVQINQADSEPTPVDPFAIFEYEETAEGIVIKKCNDITLKKVVVPDGAIKIGMKAFYAMEYLEEVVLPETLQYIGAEAFRDCKKLSTLALPKSLIKIGRAAFLGCLGFPLGDYFVIPKNVVEIEPFALPYAFLSFKNEDNWVRVDWLSKKEKFMGKVPSDKLKFADKARDYYHKNDNDTWIRK